MSAFDPSTFLNATLSEANDTQYTPVPEGEYPAVIEKVEARVVGQENPRPILSILWKVTASEVSAATGREDNYVRQTIWLDVNEAGGLDMGKGKNVALGRLRDAVGQNTPGKPWSPGMLFGQAARVRVKHSIDRRDGETINAEVSGVTKL